MIDFILKLVGLICISIITCTIIITRKDDIDVSAICIGVIFELLGLFIIYLGPEILMNFRNIY